MGKLGIDKIPIEKFQEGEDGSYAWLDKEGRPLLTLSKDEYANAEKINQIVDEIRGVQERLTKLEGK